MKRGSTLFLKGVIALIGCIVLAVCVFVLPQVVMAELAGDFDYAPILIGLYVPAIPFFFALFQAVRLLTYIEQNKAFSLLSVTALNKIKYSALAIAALFSGGMPYVFYVADRDDAPGLVALGLVIIGASLVIATAGALFQSLVQNAVDIKSENDLTV
ncbi:MAG: DUF2975 domain-containing protein [bacterium]|nr:DUF2975 domain-containing protein [bacterium]